LYLCFCSCNSYSCLKEFDALKAVYESHKDKLQILTVLADDDAADIKNFQAKSGYPWVFVSYKNQPDVIKNYDIRAFPTYYFLAPDGKLLLSPAPSPSENFETVWFEYMRNKKELK